MVVVTTYAGARDSPQSNTAFTVTDQTDDYTLDCDSDNAALGDTLGTLIKELIIKGVIKGTVTSK